jgi:hypothetical protein
MCCELRPGRDSGRDRGSLPPALACVVLVPRTAYLHHRRVCTHRSSCSTSTTGCKARRVEGQQDVLRLPGWGSAFGALTSISVLRPSAWPQVGATQDGGQVVQCRSLRSSVEQPPSLISESQCLVLLHPATTFLSHAMVGSVGGLVAVPACCHVSLPC